MLCPVPGLIRILAVIVVCGSLPACVVGQPYDSSYSGQVYTTPAYRGYYGPGSGTGYGRSYVPSGGYYGPGSGSGYDRSYAPGGGYYGPGSGTGYGRYYAPGGY